MIASEKWAHDLRQWAIPSEIIEQAPESPWIHPPALFGVPDVIADTPSHQRAREAMPTGGSILDIGCGGGIAAFAAASPGGSVFGVDHQQEMLDMFAKTADARGLMHSEVLGDWPDVSPATPQADVVTCHHVVYNVQDIVPFLTALAAHATKRVVIELPQQHPLSVATPLWKHFWDLNRPTAPGPEDLMNVLTEMGIDAELELWTGEAFRQLELDKEVPINRVRLCLPESREAEIREVMEKIGPPPARPLATIWWDVKSSATN